MDNPKVRLALHVVLAAAFFFSLQRFMMKESLEVSLVWAAIGGAGAAWLAWRQGRGGGV